MSFDQQQAAPGRANAPEATAAATPGKQTHHEAADAGGGGDVSGVNLETLKAFISRHEGYRNVVYRDSRGFPTAGIGHLLPAGQYQIGQHITEQQIESWFRSDTAHAIAGARQAMGGGFDGLDEARKMVVIDMVFNLGEHGFAGFHATIAAIRSGRFAQAASDMLQSAWAGQVGHRATEDAAIMRTGALAGGGGTGGAEHGGAEHGGSSSSSAGSSHSGGAAAGGTTHAGGSHGGTAAHGAPSGGRELKLGDIGHDVEQVQRQLHVGADGFFGPNTKRAVESFQRQHHLSVDGIIGPETRAALGGGGASHDTHAPASSHASAGHGQTNSRTGGVEAPTGGTHGGTSGTAGETHDGSAQRERLLSIARSGSTGRRPDGYCYRHVCQFLVACHGYGRLVNPYTQLAGHLGYAHDFADVMNSGGAERFGLEKLSMSSPYSAPAGSIVVVAAGSPGTHHPTAGDITVASGSGEFYNGGMMGYGGSAVWNASSRAHLLGVYVPR